MKAKKILAFLISAVMAVQSIPVYASVTDEKIVESELTEPTVKDAYILTEDIHHGEHEFSAEDIMIEKDSLLLESGLEITEDAPALYADASVVASGYCGGEGDGTNLTWELDSNGTLKISGTGIMAGYGIKAGPWKSTGNSILKVIIDSGVTNVGGYAFYRCREIVQVNLPDTITCIGDSAFQSCNSLYSINLPDSIIEIQSDAFRYSSLKSINIPKYAKIWGNVFIECDELQSIFVDSNNTNYTSIDGVLYDKNQSYLISYPAGKHGDFTIPEKTIEIGTEAFYGCKNIEKVYLPSTLKIIGWCAFSSSSITYIEIPASVTKIGNYAFRGCYQLEELHISNDYFENMNDGTFLFDYCPKLKNIILSDTVTHIPRSAFAHADNLSSIVFPPNINYIATSSFNPSGIESVYFTANAPEFCSNNAFPANTIIYYLDGTAGWTDSESYDAETGTWNGYKLEIWENDAETLTWGDYEYEIKDDGTAIITKATPHKSGRKIHQKVLY